MEKLTQNDDKLTVTQTNFFHLIYERSIMLKKDQTKQQDICFLNKFDKLQCLPSRISLALLTRIIFNLHQV